MHERDTTWTFDPRMYIDKTSLGEGLPRGGGNQTSCEFNLLYRFHSAISQRDADWTQYFIKKLLPEERKTDKSFKLEDLSPGELWEMLGTFARGEAAKEPCSRTFGDLHRDHDGNTFGDLHRDHDGRFHDADLVRILRESIDDPAGQSLIKLK